MVDVAGQLSVSELSFYLITAFPLLYVLIRYEGYVLFNFGYILIFCALQVTEAAL